MNCRCLPGFRAAFSLVLIGSLLLFLDPVAADDSKATGGGASAAEVGKKLADPLSDIWALFTEINHTWSEGKFSDGKWRSGQAVVFQPIMPIKLTPNYKLITRPTLPILPSQDVPDGFRCQFDDCIRSLPGGGVLVSPLGSASFSDKSGIGDFSMPVMVSPNQAPDDKWGWGLGPTFVFPTASENELGTDTYEIGPAFLLTYKTKRFTSGFLAQYWWNYAESSNSAEDTSHGSLLYFTWINLPKAWQVGTGPTITYNDKASSDNKWNVPVGLGVAHTRMFGKLPIKFQLLVEKSFIRQENLGKDWNLRLNVIPVIPALIKDPLFGG